LIQPRGSRSHRHALCFSEERTLLQRYLIVGYDSKGLELPHFFLDSGEEVLPVFSSEEAAQDFLSLSPLGEGWYVRGFSGGELVSTLFAFHAGVKDILLDPLPGYFLAKDALTSLVSRERFIESLIES
jgi:hypothetical protein